MMKEEQLHKQICDYIKLRYPKVLFNTDMSGMKLTMGQAKKAKGLRSSNGFPDISIYHPVGMWYGLFLEVKKATPFKLNGELKKNDHLEEQYEMLLKLNSLGYFASFTWSFNHAKEIIDRYMKVK